MEEGDCDMMRGLIREVLNECCDLDTLDLVYKILIADDIR